MPEKCLASHCTCTQDRDTHDEGHGQSSESAQQAWATDRGIEIDADGYCCRYDANLFEPLSACSRRDLTAGDGSELGREGARGKIQALHSSAALACNFFDYWRGRDLGPLRQSLDLPTRLCGLEFEQKVPTRLGGIAPNLDVMLYGCDGSVFAVESKFTEPFVKAKHKSFLKPKYFPEGQGLWRDAGLLGCQTLAESLREGRVRFELLDAAQLLKHMLGLGRSGHSWTLICLWYGAGESLSDRYADELAMFSRLIGSDSDRFVAMTYQALFDRLANLVGSEHDGWKSYLQTRYFAG